jgi:hypothetical protein
VEEEKEQAEEARGRTVDAITTVQDVVIVFGW